MALPTQISQNIITSGGTPLDLAQYQAVMRVITDLYDFSSTFRTLAGILSVPGNVIILSNA